MNKGNIISLVNILILRKVFEFMLNEHNELDFYSVLMILFRRLILLTKAVS